MPIKMFSGVAVPDVRRLARDLLAGASAAAVNIPQVLGYARIAGAPVVAGLYTVLLPLVAFAVFGSSRHLVVAADSATAAILSSSLSALAPAGSPQYMALVGMVALLTAGLLLLARIFKLGFLADFLSRTVLVGFLTGVGFQVAIAMLSDMSGMAVDSRYSLVKAWEVLRGLNHPHLPTLALSGTVTALLLLGNRFARRVPLSLVVIVATIAAGKAYGVAQFGIALIGPVAGGLPTLQLPRLHWSAMVAMLPVAGSCFVMIIAQSAATSRGFALQYHEEVDADADNLGLAAANLSAALSGAFVVNGSPTQTALAEQMGARSQSAQLGLAAVVFLVLLFLTGPLQYLPRCVLASIVFTIALGMIDLKDLRAIRRESPGEFSLALVTAGVVVGLGVEQGILVAMALSLFRHVRHSYRPHTMMLARDAAGQWIPEPATPGRSTEPGLIVYRFGADLFYANVNHFVDQIRALVAEARPPVRWLVIDCSAITDVDYSAGQSIRDLLGDLARLRVTVIFGRVSSYLLADMVRHGIAAAVGTGRIHATLHEAIAATRGGASAPRPAT